MDERRVHVTEWEALAPLIGNALETGDALLHSAVPMTREERDELEQALGKLMEQIGALKDRTEAIKGLVSFGHPAK